jgi:solute:Na+ symporter, SSS family
LASRAPIQGEHIVNLSWLDWTIVALAVVSLRFISLSTRSYCKGVADFLSANRTAGRYLLTIAGSMGNMGVISFVGYFEMYYSGGFPPIWWGLMALPIPMVIVLTRWVYWRFRETRALTMAQYLEMRYSRRFRIFAGIICWVCGMLNFGIFPAVAARFIVYFCGLPDTFQIPSLPFHISTFATVMALDLGLALMFVNMGGQISVMVTECVQGIFSNIAFIVIIGCVLLMVPWTQMVQALSSAPAEASMLHPYHTSQVKDFNIWFFLIGIAGSFYACMSWQGGQGFFSSARTPHEAQMGGIISVWRNMPILLLSLVLPIAAFTVLKLPESGVAAAVQDTLKAVPEKAIRDQMIVPITLGHLLPIGIKGLLATTMLFFSFTCHDTYMHSWGSIFIQDVVMPFRKKALSAELHIRLLRWSIAFVALFGFLFSLLYPQTQQIFMFFAITGTIWLGGSGAVIIGGLYWKRGTTQAAFATVIWGAVLGVTGLFADQIWQHFCGRNFPINGQVLWFIGMTSSVAVYVLVSLITGRAHKDANLQKLLHRGRYAVAAEVVDVKEHLRSRWLRFVGITEHFSVFDTILAVALIVWNFGWLATFFIITAIHFTVGTTPEMWAKFWHFYVILQLAVSVPATIWFTVGGIVDIRALFRTLAHTVRDPNDDGRVEHAPDDVLASVGGGATETGAPGAAAPASGPAQEKRTPTL